MSTARRTTVRIPARDLEAFHEARGKAPLNKFLQQAMRELACAAIARPQEWPAIGAVRRRDQAVTITIRIAREDDPLMERGARITDGGQWGRFALRAGRRLAAKKGRP